MELLMRFTTLASITIVFALATAGNASAQTYDFATCNPTTVAATACDTTTHTSCCTLATTTTGLLTSGSDRALILPMDYCHQDGSATIDPTPTVNVSTLKSAAQGGATHVGTNATVTSNNPTGIAIGNTVVSAGVPVARYNGTWT